MPSSAFGEVERVVLKSGRERSVKRRHPWVFTGALAAPVELPAGETVEVVSSGGEVLGYGAWSPKSQICVRMLSFDPRYIPNEDFVRNLVAGAVGRRASFLADGYTNAFRLVNAENDGLPGVIADYYDGWVVCQFTSALAERWKGVIADTLMMFAPGCKGVSERTDIKDRVKEGLDSPEAFVVLCGAEPPELVEIEEGPCRFYVDVRKGHKTGFYLDQREARRTVGALANGAEVLNCFCYTGGFGLFARACGAAKVTQVDISEEAIALAKRNETLGHFCGTQMEYVAADVFQFLRTCRDSGRQFDMIVLDPPKFASSKAALEKAARGYKDINLLAMKLLRTDGILATFSCSGAMSAGFFDKVLAEAAEDAGRTFQIIARTRPGADHPEALSFPEGAYLKGVILRAN